MTNASPQVLIGRDRLRATLMKLKEQVPGPHLRGGRDPAARERRSASGGTGRRPGPGGGAGDRDVRAGEPRRRDLRTVTTAGPIVVGVDCGTPSSLAWPYLRDGLDAAVAVPEHAAARAERNLGGLGVPSGPSGAAALAGAPAALTGLGSDTRRAELGAGPAADASLFNTEGAPAAGAVDR